MIGSLGRGIGLFPVTCGVLSCAQSYHVGVAGQCGGDSKVSSLRSDRQDAFNVKAFC